MLKVDNRKAKCNWAIKYERGSPLQQNKQKKGKLSIVVLTVTIKVMQILDFTILICYYFNILTYKPNSNLLFCLGKVREIDIWLKVATLWAVLVSVSVGGIWRVWLLLCTASLYRVISLYPLLGQTWRLANYIIMRDRKRANTTSSWCIATAHETVTEREYEGLYGGKCEREVLLLIQAWLAVIVMQWECNSIS